MKIEKISKALEKQLEQFLSSCGSSLSTFRYFSSRPVSVVRNHLVSLLVFEGDLPVAYGHLDPEDGIVWLGICVIEDYVGRGYGFSVMEVLLDEARALHITKINLTVDKGNLGAIRLYKKFGFKRLKESPSAYLYQWESSEIDNINK